MEQLALQKLGQTVYHYCGLNYINNLSSLAMKMKNRILELNLTYWEYNKFLEQNPSEWDFVIELLTINETYFYREDKQLTALKDIVLPSLKQEATNEPIKIWSAACSTGEEPYSLAIMVQETGLFEEGQVQIEATDINKFVLEKAQKAHYRKESLSFRRIPSDWLQKYFIEKDSEFKVIPTLQEMVSFQYMNLLDQKSMEKRGKYDVVFCRNVLIYFDTQTIEQVVRCFYEALNDGGILFLGHSETISNLKIGFKTVSANGAFYYRKEQRNGKV